MAVSGEASRKRPAATTEGNCNTSQQRQNDWNTWVPGQGSQSGRNCWLSRGVVYSGFQGCFCFLRQSQRINKHGLTLHQRLDYGFTAGWLPQQILDVRCCRPGRRLWERICSVRKPEMTYVKWQFDRKMSSQSLTISTSTECMWLGIISRVLLLSPRLRVTRLSFSAGP